MDDLRNAVAGERQASNKCCSAVKCRHVLVLLVFFGLFNAFAMRVNLSVAIAAMVKSTRLSNTTNATEEDTCPYDEIEPTGEKMQGTFEWDQEMQGTIIGCFFYSYIVVNILGGRISEVCGVKWTFGIGILSTAVFTMLSPIVAQWSTAAFIALRVVVGAMEGVTLPAIHCALGRWFNQGERSSMYAIMHSGLNAGTVIGQILSGILCHSDIFGWPYAFYVFGIFGLIWCVFWFALMHEHPESHPRISEEELKYISAGREGYSSERKPAPLKRILTSVAVWACAFSALARMWSYTIITYNIPSYMKEVLHYDIQQSGLLSSLPSIAEFLLTIVAGYMSDWILAKRFMGVTPTRKILNSMGLVPSVICLFLIPLVGCNRELIITLLTLSLGAHGFCTVGYITSIVDMSPTYAGTLMGLINGFSQISGVLAPLTVGKLTNGQQNSQQWYKVFYITAGISLFSMLLFMCFGSADLQPWSKEDTNEEEDESTQSTAKSNRKEI